MISQEVFQGAEVTLDVHGTEWPRDIVRFEFTNGRLIHLDSVLPADLLSAAPAAQTLSDVARAADAIPQLDWVWVDFHIGVRFAKAAAGGDPEWSSDEVWRKACMPWLGWVR